MKTIKPIHTTAPADRLAELTEFITDKTPLRDAQTPGSARREHFQTMIDNATDKLIRWEQAGDRIARLQTQLQHNRHMVNVQDENLTAATTNGQRRMGYGVALFVLFLLLTGLIAWWMAVPAAAAAAFTVWAYQNHTRDVRHAEDLETEAKAALQQVEDDLIGTVDHCEEDITDHADTDPAPGVLVSPDSPTNGAEVTKQLPAINGHHA